MKRHLLFSSLLLFAVALLLASCQITISPGLPTPTSLPFATMTPTAPATAATVTPAATTAVAATDTPPPATPTPMPPTATPIPPTATPLPPTPAAYDEQDTPEHLIGSYVNAITRQEIMRAYAYWENPPQPYDDFAAGFADTRSVMAIVHLPIAIEGAAGSMYTTLPTLLLAIHNDGSRHAYHVCYTLRRTNPEMTDAPTFWHIFNATATEAPNAGGWPFLTACPDASRPPDGSYTDQDTPEHAIAAYIDAINASDYARAYNLWEAPTMSLADFANRWQHTQRIELLMRVPVIIEGAAGSQYAAVAALLLETRTNGSQRVTKACFTTRRPNPDMTPDPPAPWLIYAATMQRVKNASGWRLANGCQ